MNSPTSTLAADQVPASREGFFLCVRCHRVVELSPQVIEAWEQAPAGATMELKCPLCRHRSVHWQAPTRERPRRSTPAPVSLERGRELWAEIYERLNFNQPKS